MMKIGVGLPATLSHVTGPLLLDWAREADVGPFSSLAILDQLQRLADLIGRLSLV